MRTVILRIGTFSYDSPNEQESCGAPSIRLVLWARTAICCRLTEPLGSLFLIQSSSISIRAFVARDEAAVVELWEICFPDDPPWNDPRDVIRRKMTVQPELFMVALVDDRVVGTVLAGFDGFRGWVNKVATRPSHQRKGRAANAPVVEFYKNSGYVVEDRVSMGKRLK